MKLKTGTRWTMTVAFALILSLAAFAGAHAADKKDKDKKDKAKPAANSTIDSGSFGIFIKGRRVATETFHVEQQNGNSIIKSQLKETGGADSPSQKSDLEITPNGELLRYEWSETSGGSLSVFPDNEFLKERIASSATAKPAEQVFLLGSTTNILDNNFFVHREILAWKYLTVDCQHEPSLKCKSPDDFQALVPQDRTSMPVRLELVGKDKISIRGTVRELLRLKLNGDQFDWTLWVDDQDHFKLMRVSIPADDTVVDRD